MKTFRNILITLIIGFIVYYFTLPAININSFGFWVFLVFLIFTYNIISGIFDIKKATKKYLTQNILN